MLQGKLGGICLLLLMAQAIGADAALADNHCPRPPGVPPGARYSCPTHTQTYQPGEPRIRHPGGSPGRGPGAAPGGAQGQAGDQGQGGSLHCQIEQDKKCHCGPRKGTARGIPCRPGDAVEAVVPTFTYYYVNGINTALGPPNPTERGTCRWDRRLIEGNLLDKAQRLPSRQVGYSYSVPIRVDNEVDEMGEETCNPSGMDRNTEARLKKYCDDAKANRLPKMTPDARNVALAICESATQFDNFRGTGDLNGRGSLAPGDVFECFRQALGYDFGKLTGAPRASGIDFTSEEPEVKRIADIIIRKFQAERQQTNPRRKNFFIVIGHSQGNFFAEGVAYRLRRNKEIFEQRLGVISLGSPTDYRSLPEPFRSKRIIHFTREDDAIVALAGLEPLGGKIPWPANVERLWPWPDDVLRDALRLVAPTLSFPFFRSPFMEEMALNPPAQCRCAGADLGLYIPLMNAHLIDNYLTDPTSSQPGRIINPQAADHMGRSRLRSPPGVSVLGDVRKGLYALKQDLLGR